MERNPGLWVRSSPQVCAANESSGKFTPLDFCYTAPMPWYSADEKVENAAAQNQFFGGSNYTRVDSHGLPRLTVFSNVTNNMSEAVKEKWQDSIQASSQGACYPFRDHHAMLELSLAKLQHDMKISEAKHALYGAQRFEVHTRSETANFLWTISRSRSFMKQLITYRSSLNDMERILHGLREEIPNFMMKNPSLADHTETHICRGDRTAQHGSKIWNLNLTRQLRSIENRFKDLIEFQSGDEATILSVIAQRDSAALARNTLQMAIMGKTTEKSGQEIHDMTKRMEIDARHMKFLAEITAFFLPLTALATFFSMDFVSVSDASGPGLFPLMHNAKCIWIYFLGLAVTSVLVFGWWYYKHITTSAGSKSLDEDNPIDLDEIEGRMEVQSQIDRFTRREYGNRKLKEALAEWEAHKNHQDDGQEPAEEADRTGAILTKILCAQRASESGENFDTLYQSVLQSEEPSPSNEN